MTVQCNAANYSFLIETFTDDGSRLMMWRIDQVVSSPFDRHNVDRVTNSIEAHLSDLNRRTGLHYSCFAQGPKDEIDKAVGSLSLELS